MADDSSMSFFVETTGTPNRFLTIVLQLLLLSSLHGNKYYYCKRMKPVIQETDANRIFVAVVVVSSPEQNYAPFPPSALSSSSHFSFIQFCFLPTKATIELPS